MTGTRQASRHHRQWVAPSAIIAFALGAVLVLGNAAAEDRPDTCFRNEAGAKVIAEFQISDGAAIREHIPLFGKAPELDGMAGPLTVLVFQGEHVAVPLLPQLQATDAPPPAFRDVVCVVTATGDEWYYFDVNVADLRP